MNELRVPKRRVTVEVRLAGRAPRQVQVFLSETAASHAGAETVADLVDGPADFLPALDEAGAMLLLHRAAITVVALPRELDAGDDDPLTLPTEHEVVVGLVDGAEVRGLVSYVRPDDRARLVDHANEPTHFLRLLDGDRVLLVHKRHVATVTPVSR